MSIRSARADDFWRKVQSRTYTSRYSVLNYRDLFCLGTGSVEFHGGITAIVGGNGVGKSTLAAALGELLETELAERFVGERPRLAGSVNQCTIHEAPKDLIRSASGGLGEPRQLTGDEIATESWWLDPGYWAFHTRSQVKNDQNFADLLEPLTPVELGTEQLSTLAYVVGKDYRQCLVYEIADYAGFDRFPYFRVEADGVSYGSEGMGQGELALMLVLWVLRDLRPGSILILEEPESHVSPRSQAALMNVMAEAVAVKGLWTIITTHSPTIAARIPVDHLRLLVREDSAVMTIARVHRHQVAAILGGGLNFSGVALVEDEVAKEVAIALLDEFAPDLLRQLEIIASAGEARITTVLQNFPLGKGWLRIIGIYDGDQRGRVREDGVLWPVTFLPGTDDPATMLVDSLRTPGAAAEFARQMRRDPATVTTALDALTGVEPRDWIVECTRMLSTTKADLVRSLVSVWITQGANRQNVKEFVAAVVRSYDAGKAAAH